VAGGAIQLFNQDLPFEFSGDLTGCQRGKDRLRTQSLPSDHSNNGGNENQGRTLWHKQTLGKMRFRKTRLKTKAKGSSKRAACPRRINASKPPLMRGESRKSQRFAKGFFGPDRKNARLSAAAAANDAKSPKAGG
jgi:hypothetical protein